MCALKMGELLRFSKPAARCAKFRRRPFRMSKFDLGRQHFFCFSGPVNLQAANDPMLWVFFNVGDNFSHERNGFVFSSALCFDGRLDREVLEGHVTMPSTGRAATPFDI